MMQLRHTYDVYTPNTRNLRSRHFRRPPIFRTGDVEQQVTPTTFTSMTDSVLHTRKAGYTYYPTPYTRYTIPQLESIINHLRANGNYKGAHMWDIYKFIVVRYLAQFTDRHHHRITTQYIPPEPSSMDYADAFSSHVKSIEFQRVKI